MSVRVTKKRMRVNNSFKERFYVQRDINDEVVARFDDKDEAIQHAKKLNEEESEWKKTIS